jgi:hypothetical protein
MRGRRGESPDVPFTPFHLLCVGTGLFGLAVVHAVEPRT